MHFGRPRQERRRLAWEREQRRCLALDRFTLLSLLERFFPSSHLLSLNSYYLFSHFFFPSFFSVSFYTPLSHLENIPPLGLLQPSPVAHSTRRRVLSHFHHVRLIPLFTFCLFLHLPRPSLTSLQVRDRIAVKHLEGAHSRSPATRQLPFPNTIPYVTSSRCIPHSSAG